MTANKKRDNRRFNVYANMGDGKGHQLMTNEKPITALGVFKAIRQLEALGASKPLAVLSA